MSHLRHILSFFLLLQVLVVNGQRIVGVVTDAETGDSIPMVSVVYKGHQVAAISSASGQYSIARHEGWNITFSAVGYKSRIIAVNNKTKARLNIKLQPDKQMLSEVTVKAKRNRYSRKNNPAVELMRRVVAAKKQTDLSQNDYYQYNKYEKITLSLNDLKPEQLEQNPFKKHPWLLEQVEVSNVTGKNILPVSVDETVSQKIYRKDPRSEKTIIMGQTSKGVNDLFQTGDIINNVIKDVFTDIDLYQDHIRLLQYPFISPISNEGIGFYRYYIEDTLAIERDSCIHLHFLPNNPNDMGFRGDLYVLKDSSLHVRRCVMTIPKQSNVNFVENVQILQEYEQLPNGQWVLSKDACSLGDCAVVTAGANTGILYVAGSDGPDPVAISAEGNVLWRSVIDDPEIYGPTEIILNPNDIEIHYECGKSVKLEYNGELISISDL